MDSVFVKKQTEILADVFFFEGKVLPEGLDKALLKIENYCFIDITDSLCSIYTSPKTVDGVEQPDILIITNVSVGECVVVEREGNIIGCNIQKLYEEYELLYL